MFKTYSAAKKVHPDIDEWLVESVRHEFGELADSIIAGSVCATTEEPWESPQVFERVVLLLNNREVVGDLEQELSVPEIAYAVERLKKEFPEELFNADIAKYIVAVALGSGNYILPPELSFAQGYIPVTKLTPAQEEVQRLHLSNVKDYIKGMETR